MNENSKQFSIIFPTRNRVERLRNLLLSIQRTTKEKKNIEVRIAYDSDDIATEDFLSSNSFDFKIITYKCQRSVNFSEDYYNFMALKCDSKYIWALNDDTEIITQDWDIYLGDKIEEFLLQKQTRICYIGINDDSQDKSNNTPGKRKRETAGSIKNRGYGYRFF